MFVLIYTERIEYTSQNIKAVNTISSFVVSGKNVQMKN